MVAAPAGPYAFISYASADRDRALLVADALAAAGIAAWLDRRSIAGGSSWSAEIVQGVRGCAALLLLVSPAAMQSPNVAQEVQLAWEARRPLLPLLLAPAEPPPALAYALAGRQWVELLDRPAEDWQPDLLRALAGLGLAPATAATPVAAVPVAPAAPAAPPSNLPRQLTSFVGRAAELAAVTDLLGSAALVTLTGVGGTGKTRLALAVAERVLPDYPDGVWLFELAPLADPGLVPQTVATALGIREQPGEALTATLIAALTPRVLLLVLDNCEHLIDACAHLAAELLRHCPGLRILATSREQLGVPGEAAYRVPSLALPPATPAPVAADLAEIEAVRLFVARAQAAQPRFALTDANAALVAQLCARLDGIPLALELAAARLRALPLDQLAARLDDRFRLLTGGSRTALPRQQTLQATLDWSHRLLSEDERTLFRRLSVFAGGWTLDAAEAVGTDEHLESWHVLDLLAGLMDKSLVILDETTGEARYRLLETVRQYARERLAETDEGAALRDRHRDWCLALAEGVEPQLTSGAQAAALARLDAEQDNLHAALAWCQAGDATTGLRLAVALHRYWSSRGLLGQGVQWLTSFLEQAPEATVARATALGRLGQLLTNAGADLASTEAAFRESEALCRALDAPRPLVHAVRNRGVMLLMRQGARAAEDALREALALSREHGDRWSEGVAQRFLGMVAWMDGDLARGLDLLEESRTLLGDVGDRQQVINTDICLITVSATAGDYGRALEIADAAEREALASGFLYMLVGVLGARSDAARLGGLVAEAVACGERALLFARDQGKGPTMAARLCLARAALAADALARARALLAEIRAEAFGAAEMAQLRYWLGRAAWQAGEPAGGVAGHLSAALRLSRDCGAVIWLPDVLESSASLLLREGSAGPATRLLAAVAATRVAVGVPRPPIEQPGMDATLAGARATLGAGAFTDSWAAGAALSLDEAVEEALALLDRLGGAEEAAP